MTKLAATLLLVFSLVGAWPQMEDGVQVPIESAVATGVVRDQNGGPLPGVTVTFRGENRFERVSVTNETGVFASPLLPAGRFTITAEKPGYPPMTYGASKPFRPGVSVSLSQGQQVKDLVLTLSRGAVISGTVFDDRGEPMPGVRVTVSQVRTGVSGERIAEELAQGRYSEVSDDRGAYRIFGLPPGDIAVRAASSGGFSIWADSDMRAAYKSFSAAAGDFPAGRPQPHGFAPVFYPDASTLLTARILRVGVGDELSGIDLRMRLRPVTQLDGTVTTPDGRLSAARLRLWERSQLSGNLSVTEFSTLNGRFSRSSLWPGDYSIMATVNDPPQFALEQFSVVDAVTASITLQLKPSIILTGQFVFDGETQAAARVTNFLVTASTTEIPVSGMLITSRTNDKGAFAISGLVPGSWRLGVSLPVQEGAPWMIRSVQIGKNDVTDQAFSPVPGETSTVIVTLTDKLSELSGVVQTSSGLATDYFVVVVPTDTRYWQSGRRRTTRVEADGRYAFGKLPPGEYRVAATLDLMPSDVNDAAVLEALARVSVPVAIGLGEKKTLNLRIQR